MISLTQILDSGDTGSEFEEDCRALVAISAALEPVMQRNYDQARALTPETRQLWQDLLSAHIDWRTVSLVIDLGCGTGRFSELLAAEFEARVIAAGLTDEDIDRLIEEARKVAQPLLG